MPSCPQHDAPPHWATVPGLSTIADSHSLPVWPRHRLPANCTNARTPYHSRSSGLGELLETHAVRRSLACSCPTAPCARGGRVILPRPPNISGSSDECSATRANSCRTTLYLCRPHCYLVAAGTWATTHTSTPTPAEALHRPRCTAKLPVHLHARSARRNATGMRSSRTRVGFLPFSAIASAEAACAWKWQATAVSLPCHLSLTLLFAE